MPYTELLHSFNTQFANASAEKILSHFLVAYKNKIALASSLGAEDQVLTDMIIKTDATTKIFTLDTGRLFPETYSLIDRTNLHYGIKIDVYFPDSTQVETMVKNKGINLFYESIENRKECCHTRKIAPLKRALQGLDMWICGLRREQSITRNDMQVVEWDASNNMLKLNPLINWSEQDVWDYLKKLHIPYNKLHDKNFPSIGCQPCTRAIEAGQDVRAGRWWWEDPEHKECGLHKK